MCIRDRSDFARNVSAKHSVEAKAPAANENSIAGRKMILPTARNSDLEASPNAFPDTVMGSGYQAAWAAPKKVPAPAPTN